MLVESVFNSDTLTMQVTRVNARQARKKCSSKHTPIEADNNNIKQKEDKKHKVTHTLIEQCVGLFRKRQSHQNTMDFDGKYLKDEVLKTMIEEMTTLPKMEQE